MSVRVPAIMMDHSPAQAVDAPVLRPQTIAGDRLTVELRYFAHAETVSYAVPAGQAILIAPLNGDARLTDGDAIYACPGRSAFLYGREGTLRADWRASSSVLVAHFHRDELSLRASVLLGEGRRMAGCAAVIAGNADDRAIERLAAIVEDRAAVETREADFYQVLAGWLLASDQRDAIVPRVRIVTETMQFIRNNHAAPFDLDTLARRSGVTAGTLRKSFRACLGMTVKAYAQKVRLDWAHERLSGTSESRSIAQMAVVSGFVDGPAFSRSYLRRFGETPSQTRSRAVRAAS